MGGPRQAEARPDRLARAYLKRGVHFAALGDDVVVLDTGNDTYSCIPDSAAHLRIGPEAVVASSDWIEALTAVGLTANDPDPGRKPIPALPTAVLPFRRLRPKLTTWIALARAVLHGRRHGPAAPIGVLASSLPLRRDAGSDPARIAAIVAGFQILSPWIPNQGACLFRASILLRALRYGGQDADWVFGVRTWPFAAHCWLQVGDAVLDDDPDRVALFTPIMAI